MYTPSHFIESRLQVLHELIREQPFATLVADTNHGMDAEHLPILLDESRGSYGVLQGHVARANPVWQELGNGTEVLVIFQGPHHYISPNWYPSKREHGQVVPTWNYIVVHAHGHISWIDEPHWLKDLLERTTDSQEEGRKHPWRVDDAPAEFIERMLEAIVGFEIHFTGINGKWKLSQNRSAQDRLGVIAGLSAESNEAAAEIAKRMREAMEIGDDDK